MTCDEEIVSGKAEEWFDRAWDTRNHDPESAGDDQLFMSTYKHWVGYQSGTCAKYLRDVSHQVA